MVWYWRVQPARRNTDYRLEEHYDVTLLNVWIIICGSFSLIVLCILLPPPPSVFLVSLNPSWPLQQLPQESLWPTMRWPFLHRQFPLLRPKSRLPARLMCPRLVTLPLPNRSLNPCPSSNLPRVSLASLVSTCNSIQLTLYSFSHRLLVVGRQTYLGLDSRSWCWCKASLRHFFWPRH